MSNDSNISKLMSQTILFPRYYIATAPGQPGVRHLYRRHVVGGPDPEDTCLTCPGQQQFNSSACVSSLSCEWAEARGNILQKMREISFEISENNSLNIVIA